jgi:hypothetical protein
MLNNIELTAQYARERHSSAIAAAAHDRLVLACEGRLAITRRAARPLGRALFSLGTWLLRYGKDERSATLTYTPPAGR